MGKASTKDDVVYDHRKLVDVLRHDVTNYVYFFAPLVVVHNAGWWLKPYITDDPRGPWELLWHQFLDRVNDDPYTLFVYGTFWVTVGFYWLTGFTFQLMDYTQKPSFLMKYKIQPGKNVPPDAKHVIKVISLVFFNQTLSIPALMLTWRNRALTADQVRSVPDASTAFFHIFVCMMAHDCIFYHAHRLFHHRLLYKHMHKIHHEWQAPIAMAANYAHPVEHIVTAIISGSAGILITDAAIPVSWIWLVWIEFQIQNDHSGYHFPVVFSPEFHDYHHLKFHTSYGWLSFWDWFYGTDVEFVKTKVNKKRHIRLHTTKSARELFPDEKGK